ncbi:aminoglycoside phosphotransferase family protein [Candidatus Poribacteria bacterium]|jgi:aminoglycoside phosphotransferase (APT) family kinase protein|nr:aminoglycoside phosphotransferase family protein [Candidatus Poribacteria bacterium]
MHELVVERRRGARERVVLRRYVRADWLAREPDLAPREARALRLASRAEVATPELIAVDADGSECDVPAVLMSRVPGRVRMEPRDLDGWLRQMAEVLPAIHAVDDAEVAELQRYQTWADLDELEAPRWTREPEAWAAVIALAQGRRPRVKARFIHRDYHPMNVVWSRGRLSGVVDWTNASVGPPGNDVAWCRQNLVASHGLKAAEQFRELYEAVAGEEQHPVWDALGVIEMLPGGGPQVAQLHDVGLTSLTRRTLRARFDSYAVSIARRV